VQAEVLKIGYCNLTVYFMEKKNDDCSDDVSNFDVNIGVNSDYGLAISNQNLIRKLVLKT